MGELPTVLRSRRGWRLRTIRQRRGRARKGQVAAVATILGLLMVVSFIANYVLLQLPGEMSTVELEHEAQVENQLSRLQATVLAEAAHPSTLLALSSPVTLGSGSSPPFGPPTPGAISPEADAVRTSGVYQIAQVVPAPPAWNLGSSCANGFGQPCAGNSNTFFYNYSGNGSILDIKVTGGNNAVVYNFTGSNDTVTITALGNSVQSLIVVVNGSDDAFTFVKGGSTNKNPVASFIFFGERDTMSLDPSSAINGNIAITVAFVGTLSQLCPYGNLSNTDRMRSNGTAGNSGLTVNVSWWNAVGYVSPRHVMTYPGGISSQTIGFQNETGYVQCAFTKSYPSTYTTLHEGGLVVHLYNRYQPGADVVYEDGAIILAQQGGSGVMLSPPPFTTASSPSGLSAKFTLVNLLSGFASQSGVTTAAVTSQLLAVHTVSIHSGVGGFFLSSPFFINVTTLYPTAWLSYFTSHGQLFPGGASCVPISVIPAPYTCLNPPPGIAVNIDSAVVAQSITVTEITATLGLD
ncbi:MAG: hypothetical protein ACREDK_00305 [Thermoplasmata archaeon]